MVDKRKHYRVKNLKSVRVIVETEEGKEEFATKNPSALVASTLEEKGKSPPRAGIQIVGQTGDILFAYYTLTKQLIEAFGDKLVLRVLSRLFAKKFDEMTKKAKMAEMVAFGKKDRVIN